MKDLKDLRKEITAADDEMAEIFVRRMKLVREVAEYKMRNSLPVLDPGREAEVLENGAARVADEELQSYYISLLREVMAISRRYQTTMMEGLKVAYCGTEGAFAHIAACPLFPTAKTVAFSSFKRAYEAVETGECDCAMLPVENSFAGDVDQVNDLMFSGNLHVNGMYDLPVTHDLLGLPGVAIDDIKTVVSHPQAISQCSAFIRKNGYKVNEFPNTAMAAKYVAEKKDPSIAAIASLESAELFALKVIEPHINSSSTNTTRFAAFSRSRSTAEPKSKMGNHFILTFTVKNEAGALAKTLNIIGAHGFNMCSLKSRPMKDLMWNYYFYMELDGDILTEDGQDMLHALGSVCDRLRLVGSFTSQKNG